MTPYYETWRPDSEEYDWPQNGQIAPVDPSDTANMWDGYFGQGLKQRGIAEERLNEDVPYLPSGIENSSPVRGMASRDQAKAWYDATGGQGYGGLNDSIYASDWRNMPDSDLPARLDALAASYPQDSGEYHVPSRQVSGGDSASLPTEGGGQLNPEWVQAALDARRGNQSPYHYGPSGGPVGPVDDRPINDGMRAIYNDPKLLAMFMANRRDPNAGDPATLRFNAEVNAMNAARTGGQQGGYDQGGGFQMPQVRPPEFREVQGFHSAEQARAIHQQNELEARRYAHELEAAKPIATAAFKHWMEQQDLSQFEVVDLQRHQAALAKTMSDPTLTDGDKEQLGIQFMQRIAPLQRRQQAQQARDQQQRRQAQTGEAMHQNATMASMAQADAGGFAENFKTNALKLDDGSYVYMDAKGTPHHIKSGTSHDENADKALQWVTAYREKHVRPDGSQIPWDEAYSEFAKARGAATGRPQASTPQTVEQARAMGWDVGLSRSGQGYVAWPPGMERGDPGRSNQFVPVVRTADQPAASAAAPSQHILRADYQQEQKGAKPFDRMQALRSAEKTIQDETNILQGTAEYKDAIKSEVLERESEFNLAHKKFPDRPTEANVRNAKAELDTLTKHFWTRTNPGEGKVPVYRTPGPNATSRMLALNDFMNKVSPEATSGREQSTQAEAPKPGSLKTVDSNLGLVEESAIKSGRKDVVRAVNGMRNLLTAGALPDTEQTRGWKALIDEYRRGGN